MDVAVLLLGIMLGAGAGALGAWALVRARMEQQLAEAASRSSADVAVALTRLEERDRHVVILQEQLGVVRGEVDAKRSDLTALREEQAGLVARAEGDRRAAAEKLEMAQSLVSQSEAKLREAFESMSSDALRRNNQSFLELAKETLGSFQQSATGDLEKRQQAIDALVRPIRESLEKFDTKIHDVEKARIDAYAGLKTHLTTLEESQQMLRGETASLVKALRTPHVRGQWGEMQLRRVVEIAGMLEYCDFRSQQTLQTEDGALRPDMIVNLPGDKTVVIDAKTPLDAYVSANQTDDDTARAELMRTHVRQVRDHISKLSDKRYWSHVDGTPEYVVMFLPGEMLYTAALQHDPELLEFAARKNVLIASPATLIAYLRAIAHGWSQERIARNAERISELGRELYDRLQTMAGHFDDLRRKLDGAVESYNRAIGSLEGRVMVSARRFGELGVSTPAPLEELGAIDRSARALQPGTIPVEEEAEQDALPEFLAAER
ncbi:MAG: DNA recombination protein RmuC [Dehalococcoidia bacterium]